MSLLQQDLKYSMRTLARSPGFTAVALLTLALGIGGSTAIFSVVDGVLLRPLPYPNPSRIVRVFEVNSRGHHISFSDPDFQDVRDQDHSLGSIAEFAYDIEPVSGGAEPVLVNVAAVSSGFFDTMGVHPLDGRGFPPEALKAGGAPVALVSYGYWQRYLGGTRELAGRQLKMSAAWAFAGGSQLYSIVGVMPRGFSFPENTDVWIPREQFPPDASRTGHNWSVIARLRANVALPAAQAETSAIAKRTKQRYGQYCDMTDAALVPLADQITGGTRPALLILLGAVGLLLLVACANVANLLLARAARRQRELAVRVALGASRKHLVGQFVTESLFLSVGGAVLGLSVAIWGVKALLALEPGNLPRAAEVGVHPAVLVFSAGIAILVAVGLGLVTALHASASAPHENLKGGERTQSGGASSQRLRLILMGAQIAVTLALLVGAGLLGKSFLRLLAVHPGFRTSGIVTMNLTGVRPNIDPLHPRPGDTEAVAAAVGGVERLASDLRRIPGVEAVGGINGLPLAAGYGCADGDFAILGPNEKPPTEDEMERFLVSLGHDPSRKGHADYCVADGDYFRAMGIPLLRGRAFQATDGRGAPQVAVISQSLAAQQKWPGGDPIGQRIEFGNMDGDLTPITVVGVVGDVRDARLDTQPTPTLYVSFAQRPIQAWTMSMVMLTRRPAAAIIPTARQLERAVEPDVPATFDTMENVVAQSVSNQRFNLLLLGAFALTALIVALMGVYGVGSYLVSQRTKEMGIRIALGAEPGDLVRMVTGESLKVIVAGAVVGALASFALTRLLRTLLFGVSAGDPMTFVVALALVVVAALAASYVPARRAARVDPVTALHEQ